MAIIKLAINSLLNRKFTAILTILSIALSITLLLGVERMRTESRNNFANTISGTDLIVGARSGSIQLLLYSVFRIGNATNNISWQSYLDIAHHKKVKWSIPISLGDSHKGFRVMGTNADYFHYYRYGQKRELRFSAGAAFQGVYDAVIGADIAQTLHYKIGDKIVLAHGAGKVNLVKHDTKPFTIVGILNKTGTPVDQTIHVSLQGIEAIHVDWTSGAKIPNFELSAERAAQQNLTPKTITAFLLGLNSKISTFQVQRFINEYQEEPLLAILPGIALQELWNMMGVAEQALMIISVFVIVVGLIGMVTAILTSLNERRREMAILRSMGARPVHIFSLIMGEAMLITLSGALLGTLLLYVLLLVGQPIIEAQFGLFIPINSLSHFEITLLGSILLAGLLVSIIPGYQAYKQSLSDGMTIRL